MNHITHYTQRALTLIALLAITLSATAAEVVYRIVEYNKKTGEFILAPSGQVPPASYATFENSYGATTGNRYNQIPRHRKASLNLNGWQGCTIKSITFSMCSNSKAGQVGFTVYDDETPLYTMPPADFASTSWFGQWVSKDLGLYVDITKPISATAFTTPYASIEIQGGTQEGSVYLGAITIQYDAPQGIELQSPLGWIYQKLEKKSTLNDGDEVMIFRNGCAAAQIDPLATTHYLDALPITQTTNVTNPDVLCFTLHKAPDANLYTLTNPKGQRLSATAPQTLAWDEGHTLWSISLGYDGATITSQQPSYGTLRFNAPAENYARFALYTSTTLPLPFLYRKVGQQQPVAVQTITFEQTDIEASLQQGHLAIKPTLWPTNATDQRLVWHSSHTAVATVNAGYVTLLAPGTTTITAQSIDGTAKATLQLTVTQPTSISTTNATTHTKATRKVLKHHRIIICTPNAQYDLSGARR